MLTFKIIVWHFLSQKSSRRGLKTTGLITMLSIEVIFKFFIFSSCTENDNVIVLILNVILKRSPVCLKCV